MQHQKIPQGISINFLINKERRKYVESISQEYLSVLAILYGDFLESGQHAIHDYGRMTMLEVENELRVRTLMYRGRRIQKQRQLRDAHTQNEQDMLEQLKRIS